MRGMCGKGIGFRGIAEHKVTSTLAQPPEHYTADNELMFGLMAEPTTGSATDPSVKTNGIFHTVNAFLDQLDEIWRGPPPTLWHVAHYIEYIVLLAPRYRLASHNCYYFARLLMYVIGLRHYSFPSLASGKPQYLAVRSVRHDPSGISMLFRFLRAEEESNGVLLYARLMKFTMWLSVVLLAGGVIGSGSYICTRVDIFTPIFPFLLVGSFIFGAFCGRSCQNACTLS